MKATAILTATLGLALGSLHAQTVPPFINYQGKVTDSAGVGLGTGTPVNRKVIFRIFDAPTAGTRLWSEQHTVTISNGEFSVLLGNGINANYAGADETPLKTATPLDTVFTSAGILRYVEIVVDNGDNTLNATDAPIAPRQQITSTAYCFRARSADTITNGTDLQLNNSADYGLGWYGSTKQFNGTAVNGPVLYGQSGGALGSVNGGTRNIALRWNSSGQVGIGSADLSGAAATTKLVLQGDDANAVPLQLNIRGNTDINKRLLLGYNTTSNYGSLQAYSAASTASNLLLNPVGGNVGIGTTTPASPLTVKTGPSNFGFEHTDGTIRVGSYVGGSAGGGWLGTFSNHPLSFFTNNSPPKMTIGTNGYVGIGDTNPTSPLTVRGNYDAIVLKASTAGTGSYMAFRNSDGTFNGLIGTDGAGFGSSTTQFGLGSWTNHPIVFYTQGVQRMTIAAGGNVGIGTSAPTQGKLVVSGQTSSYLTNPYYINGGGPGGIASSSWYDTSIYATNWIYSATGLMVASDARIKTIKGRSDGSRDLEVLKAIEVTDYTFKDTVAKGDRPQKKVIAQQLEAVYPQAVTQRTEVVPDIYRKAIMKDGWVTLATDLKKGERVRLMGGKEDEICEVLEVKGDRFRTAFKSADGDIFVYGREVKDFRTVEYEAVAMLNVSATQELARQLEQQKAENAGLKERLAELEKSDKARDARMAAIEKLLESPDQPATRTVSLKQGE